MSNKAKKLNNEIKKARKEAIKRTNHKYVHWKCIKCGNVRDIMMSPRNIPLYTTEREKNFICITCKED